MNIAELCITGFEMFSRGWMSEQELHMYYDQVRQMALYELMNVRCADPVYMSPNQIFTFLYSDTPPARCD